METAHSRPQSLWKNADFLKFWCGQTISEIGSHITRDGLPLLAVLTLGATPLQMGLLSAAGSLPVLLVSLHAGVWVDRLRRRPVMMAADAGLALALLTVPLAHFLGVLRIEQLYLVAMLTGVLAVIFDLAYHAYLPSLVERDHLVEGNSKMAFSESVAELAGSSLAGILVQLLTAPVAILVDSLSFLASLLGIAAIRKPEPPPAPAREVASVSQELREGLRFVFSSPVLRALAFVESTHSFFGSFFGVLYSLYTIRDLGLTPAAVGLTIAMGGAGNLLGALLAAPMARRLGLGRTLLFALLASAAATLLIPLAGGPMALVLVMMFAAQLVGDGLSSVYAIHETSLRQAVTPDRLLGRARSSVTVLTAALYPLGALVAGALADTLGARVTLLIAVGGFFLSALWMVFSPVLRLTDHPLPEES